MRRHRIARRPRHGCDGGVMEHVVDPLHRPPAHFESRRVAPDETNAITHGAQILAAACREVIEHGDLGAVAREALDEMGANESSTAGDAVAHELGHDDRCISCREPPAPAFCAAALLRYDHRCFPGSLERWPIYCCAYVAHLNGCSIHCAGERRSTSCARAAGRRPFWSCATETFAAVRWPRSCSDATSHRSASPCSPWASSDSTAQRPPKR